MLAFWAVILGRTPPGVRELKRVQGGGATYPGDSRTPPGVRELKQIVSIFFDGPDVRRTPPGVRELKRVPRHQ